jgi:hypothetical protein
VLCLTDSRVALGAWAKGRSSTRRLKRVLRCTLGHLLLGKLRVACIWISTHTNPADHPSRFRPLPPRKAFDGSSLFAGIVPQPPEEKEGSPKTVGEQDVTDVDDVCGLVHVEPSPRVGDGESIRAREACPRGSKVARESSHTQVPRCRATCLPEGQRYFLELWAGSGRLSGAVRQAGLPVLEPVDAYTRDGTYRPEMDLRTRAV